MRKAKPKPKGHSRMNVNRKKRKNPSLSPTDRKSLASAKRLSKQFHGNVEVVELSAKERKPLSRYAVVAGELDKFTYAPSRKSKRGEYKYEHETGDRGFGRPKAKAKPLLVVDPKTKRSAIVSNRSPMKFSGDKGFVG